jgi:small subunit ribosomal protein S4
MHRSAVQLPFLARDGHQIPAFSRWLQSRQRQAAPDVVHLCRCCLDNRPSTQLREIEQQKGTNLFITKYKATMSRYRGPRLRVVRRLGDLPGFTSKLPKKQAPPGQHGKAAKKLSQYGIRLQEKQKLRFNYGITESQLIRYVREARRVKGSTGEVLLQLLEMRLDNVVFRLGLAPTIAAARQLIRHGHILVSNQKATIPSYQCKPKTTISVPERKQSRELVTRFVAESTRSSLPPHLSFNREGLTGTVTGNIDRQSVGLRLNELLVVEFYSRKV